MLTKEQATLLIEGAKLLQIALTNEDVGRIATYLEELGRWAKIVDLVSQSDPETIIRKHILDSLAPLSVLPLQGRLLDLGSGAGFPGLPIAIARTTLEVTLLEPRRKRVNFLKEVIRKTNLSNTHAYEGRAEEFAKQEKWQSSFDSVITRATWKLHDFITLATPFLKPGGTLIAMKGTRVSEELRLLAIEQVQTKFFRETQYTYRLPYGKEERIMFLFIEKSST